MDSVSCQRSQIYNCKDKYLKICDVKITLGQSNEKNSVYHIRVHK